MVLSDPSLADRTLLYMAAKVARAKRQAPDWTVGEGLSSLLKAFPVKEDEDREPLDVDTITPMGRLLQQARQWQKERGESGAA